MSTRSKWERDGQEKKKAHRYRIPLGGPLRKSRVKVTGNLEKKSKNATVKKIHAWRTDGAVGETGLQPVWEERNFKTEREKQKTGSIS